MLATKLASWPKRGMTLAGRSISLLLGWLLWVLACLPATFVLVWMILPSIFRKQSPMPNQTRILPIPIRQGSDIFVIMPDGRRVAIDPLVAITHGKAWAEVVAGALVYEKTKLKAK